MGMKRVALFDCPVRSAVGMAVDMGRKKSATVAPEEWPDLITIGVG